ncbi:N-acetyltransferase [Pseudidiomarina aestuarii]|uniref:N-acetyltransferase n=1 Tax=Pseudidiomarina aestuarii TaxID=624146 RepID=A0A7Z7ESQ7_9GAMM|nr:N-acetyltransferase [Pseudidiomarina aestuarii]RUO39146.1 N-acetyltransferase [Pseudidiomarina aestuarii]
MKSNPSTWVIQSATLADVDDLVALEARCFDYSRMGRRSFQRLIRGSSGHFTIARLVPTQELVGYTLLLTRRNSQVWRLYSIATAPEARGTGLGRALLEAAINMAREHGARALSLEVKVDNAGAIALYEKLDFAVTDLLPEYYDDGTDGYRMRLSWTDASPGNH